MEELKTCPFCGSECAVIKDRRYPSMSSGIDAWHVECPNYECVIYKANHVYFRRRKDAVSAWNKRTGDA